MRKSTQVKIPKIPGIKVGQSPKVPATAGVPKGSGPDKVVRKAGG